MRAAAIEGLANLRITRVLPQLRAIARPWPFSREPGIVKEAAYRAVDQLENVVEQNEVSGEPED
jgi:hypothetical protein